MQPRRPVPENVVLLTQRVLDHAFAVHSEIGPGCFERVYETCLARALVGDSLRAARQVAIPFVFRGERIDAAFRVDLLVEDVLLVEVKATPDLLPIHQAQARTYLSLSGKPVLLLLNFGAAHLRDGFDRIVHRDYVFLPPSRSRRFASGPRDLVPSGAAPQGPREGA